jgi:hypothetical protein
MHAVLPFADVIAIVLQQGDGGRVAMGPIAGAGLGDGWRRDTSAGARVLAFVSDDVVVGAELRDVTAGAIGLGPAPTAAGSIDLGYRVARAKLAAGDGVLRFDLFASAGAGAVWIDRHGGDRASAALTLAISARVHLTDRAVLELGIHDDAYDLHAPGLLEARASLSWMLGDAHDHCAYIDAPGRRNVLEGQPAVRDQ